MRPDNAPVVTLLEAVTQVRAWQAAGLVVVFTNGVFDLLHPGHLRYLQRGRAEGARLVVAVNADASVRRSKGPDRPIHPAHERAELLSGFSCVDLVLIFDEATPAAVIEALQPDVLVKGADWAPDAIVGRETVEARGGRVVRVPIEDGHSTTSLARRARSV
jgi:rfaE bifunctional protein nucleotidyltransferase chain/domain